MNHDYLERSYNQAILPAKSICDLGEYVSADSTDIEKPRSTPSSATEPTPHDAYSFWKSFTTAISTALALLRLHFLLSFCLFLGLWLVRHDFIS